MNPDYGRFFKWWWDNLSPDEVQEARDDWSSDKYDSPEAVRQAQLRWAKDKLKRMPTHGLQSDKERDATDKNFETMLEKVLFSDDPAIRHVVLDRPGLGAKTRVRVLRPTGLVEERDDLTTLRTPWLIKQRAEQEAEARPRAPVQRVLEGLEGRRDVGRLAPRVDRVLDEALADNDWAEVRQLQKGLDRAVARGDRDDLPALHALYERTVAAQQAAGQPGPIRVRRLSLAALRADDADVEAAWDRVGRPLSPDARLDAEQAALRLDPVLADSPDALRAATNQRLIAATIDLPAFEDELVRRLKTYDIPLDDAGRPHNRNFWTPAADPLRPTTPADLRAWAQIRDTDFTFNLSGGRGPQALELDKFRPWRRLLKTRFGLR